MENRDIFFLKETLKLVKKGKGRTFPNPMVGAVIVKNNKIIAKGYHRKAGFPHAEVEALRNAKEDMRGATLYVSLEPCSHYGKTPPCVDAIIQAGIQRVVCATQDPNPKVKGNGITLLQKAGINVSVGLLEEEARKLNEAFFTFHEKQRPFIAIKFASSLDGKIATRTFDSKWITNEKARAYARSLRSEYQAILVGVNTVLRDNPHLGVLQKGKKDPLRIILDSTLKIPLTSNVLRDNNVLIATTTRADKQKQKRLAQRGIKILTFKDNQVPLLSLLQKLRKMEVISILVEGGGEVLGSFIDARVADKLYAFYAPLIIGNKKAISAIAGRGNDTIKNTQRLHSFSIKRFGDNTLLTGNF